MDGITLRGVSTVTDHGIPFVQSGERTYTVGQSSVTATQNGLTEPARKIKNLGKEFSGGGVAHSELTFSTADRQAFNYQLTSADLTCGVNSIPLIISTTEIRPVDTQPSNVKLQWDATSVVPGAYSGRVEAYSASLQKKWTVDLLLTVE